MGVLFSDRVQNFEVNQGPVEVSARGVSERGLMVRVSAEGEAGDEEALKARVADFFRDARLRVPPEEAGASELEAEPEGPAAPEAGVEGEVPPPEPAKPAAAPAAAEAAEPAAPAPSPSPAGPAP